MSLYQRLISEQIEKTAGLPRYLKNLQDVPGVLRMEARHAYRNSAAGGDATSAYIANKLENAIQGTAKRELKATKVSRRAALRNAKRDAAGPRGDFKRTTVENWNALGKADYDIAFRKNNPVLLPGYGKPSVDPARPLAQFEQKARRLYREGRQARQAATERMGAAAPKVPKKISDMSDAEILERLNRVAALTGKPVKPISQKELDGIRTSAARLQAGLPILPTKPTARQTEEAIQSRLAGERFDRRLKAYGGVIVAGGTLLTGGVLGAMHVAGKNAARRRKAIALGLAGAGAGAGGLGYAAYRANKK